MVDDTVTLLELLRDRFGGKTFVAGFSFGATFAAYAALRRFDKSAHTPHLEEPAKFRDLLMTVTASRPQLN